MGPMTPPLDLSSVEVIETAPYPPLITREEATLILAKVKRTGSRRARSAAR